jgi:colanic acid biosynthesis glycosyl transferase WcaI
VRILILTQHYPPEVTAAAARVEPFAEGLAARGHEVEVICAVPNHPRGVIESGYRGRLLRRIERNGVRVSYVWIRVSPSKRPASRIAIYASYAAMATVVGSTVRRPDVIWATSPPLPVGAAAMALALRFRAPWVLDVRDLWPEAAVVLGQLTNPKLVRAAERLERRLYASAAAITTVTEPFRSHISAIAPAGARIALIPNGTSSLWLDAAALDVDRAELGLPTDRFVWTYAGNLSIAYGLEAAVDAAALLGEEFRLLFLGEGPVRARLEERAAASAADSVEFRDLVPARQAARYMRASDALLVPVAAEPALEKMVPSKLFDCCAVGRPVLLAAAGEARRLAEEAGAALPVPPGDAAALADAVRRVRDDTDLASSLAERGPAFAARYVREDQVDRLADLLDAVA